MANLYEGRDPSKVKLAIVDDHRLFAEGMRNLLLSMAGFGECLLYFTPSEALAHIPREKPHLALVDINLPEMNGVELTRRLRKALPTLRILNLSQEENKETVLKVLSSGSCGYLVKSTSFASVERGIYSALEGDVVIGMEIAPLVFRVMSNRLGPAERTNSPVLDRVSPRELEVLHKIAQGKNNQAIAGELFISEKTVKNHITNLLDKLDISDRLQLTVFAIHEGLGQEE